MAIIVTESLTITSSWTEASTTNGSNAIAGLALNVGRFIYQQDLEESFLDCWFKNSWKELQGKEL